MGRHRLKASARCLACELREGKMIHGPEFFLPVCRVWAYQSYQPWILIRFGMIILKEEFLGNAYS